MLALKFLVASRKNLAPQSPYSSAVAHPREGVTLTPPRSRSIVGPIPDARRAPVHPRQSIAARWMRPGKDPFHQRGARPECVSKVWLGEGKSVGLSRSQFCLFVESHQDARQIGCLGSKPVAPGDGAQLLTLNKKRQLSRVSPIRPFTLRTRNVAYFTAASTRICSTHKPA